MKEKQHKIKEVLLENLNLSPKKKRKNLNLSPLKRRSYNKQPKTDLNMPYISLNENNINNVINNVLTKELTTINSTKENEKNIIKSLIITKVENLKEEKKYDKNNKNNKHFSLTENNFYKSKDKQKLKNKNKKNFFLTVSRNDNKLKRGCYSNNPQKLLSSLGINSFNYLLTKDLDFKNIKPSKDVLESKHFVQVNQPFLIKKKQKFPRIYNTEALKYQKYEGLSKNVLEFNKELVDNLYRENQKTFTLPFSIIKKNRFNKKFQNPFVNKNLLEEGEKKEITILPTERLSTIYFETFIDKNIKKSKKIELDIKEIFLKFKRSLIIACEQFKHFRVSLNNFHKFYKNLNNHPLNFTETEELIKAIKVQDLNYSLYLLDNYYYCVFDFDLFWQTPLHWAAKRNLYKIIPKIIEYGGNVYQKDFQGKTPLHLAIINGNIEAVLYLFIFLSSPVVKDDNNKRPIDYIKEDDLKMKFICNKAYLIYLKNQFQKYSYRYEQMQVEFSTFVVVELKYDIDVEAYTLIKNMNEDFMEILRKSKNQKN